MASKSVVVTGFTVTALVVVGALAFTETRGHDRGWTFTPPDVDRAALTGTANRSVLRLPRRSGRLRTICLGNQVQLDTLPRPAEVA